MKGETVQKDHVLLARLADAAQTARRRARPVFIGFLDERQAAVAMQAARRMAGVGACLWGGYNEAQRVMLGIADGAAPEKEQAPLAGITVRFRRSAQLSHRDFLGSLLALGVEREALGDILVEEGRAVFFVRQELEDFFLTTLTHVGGEGVKAFSLGAGETLPQGKEPLPISGTVASARLDCIVAALVRVSRSEAAGMIIKGLVFLNSLECESVSHEVCEGDKVSVRGYGKFAVAQLGPPTRKQRLVLGALQYQ